MMFPIVQVTDAPAALPIAAAELLDALGVGPTLPERLAQDASGRRFAPAQINPQERPQVLRQLTLLLSPEPIGGAEPQIRANQRQMQDRVEAEINQALARAHGASRALLAALIQETRARKERLEQEVQRQAERLRQVQEQIHRWQTRSVQHSRNGSATVFQWLFGGPARLSLAEVIGLWNEREQLALRSATLAASGELFSWLLGVLSTMLNQLDDLLMCARRAAAELRARADTAAHTSAIYLPWTVQIDPATIAEALLSRVESTGVVAEVLRRQANASDPAALARWVEELALHAVTHLLAPLQVTDLIELEVGSAALTDVGDPLVLVGQLLLEQLTQPTWQLVRGAGPRVETLQVTPDGQPLFSLDGLTSAAYGSGLDRLGFLQVQLDVALDELELIRADDASFQALLRQCNLYVLEELAVAWEAAQRTPTTIPIEVEDVADLPSSNGTTAVSQADGGVP